MILLGTFQLTQRITSCEPSRTVPFPLDILQVGSQRFATTQGIRFYILVQWLLVFTLVRGANLYAALIDQGQKMVLVPSCSDLLLLEHFSLGFTILLNLWYGMLSDLILPVELFALLSQLRLKTAVTDQRQDSMATLL